MAAFDRLHPALQHQVVNALGWRSLRPVQELAIDATLDGANLLVLAACLFGLAGVAQQRWNVAAGQAPVFAVQIRDGHVENRESLQRRCAQGAEIAPQITQFDRFVKQAAAGVEGIHGLPVADGLTEQDGAVEPAADEDGERGVGFHGGSL